MNLLEFKSAVRLRWKITTASVLFSAKESLAYVGNNYGSLASTVFYTITYLMFITVLYGNVKTLAGYTYPEMLLFIFFTQLNFYFTWIFSRDNIDSLTKSVNTGELDLVLSKPIPALWFVSSRRININELLFSAAPAMIPLIILLTLNMSGISINKSGLFLAFVCLIFAQIMVHCFQFIISLTCFWTGEGKYINNAAMELSTFGEIPWEGYPGWFKIIGTTLIPCLVGAGITTSLALGKTTNYLIVVFLFFMTVSFIGLKILAWKFALKHYSSASS